MNQVQRKFLIDRIEKQVKISIEALNNNKPEAPNLNNYLLHRVLSGNFKIKSGAEIKEAIRQKALTAKANQNWMTGERSSYNGYRAREFKLDVNDLFDVDEEYKTKQNEYREATAKIDEQIRKLSIQGDTLVTRIQLASDKTLDRMINEIDDMGDLSLIDTKIKLLNA